MDDQPACFGKAKTWKEMTPEVREKFKTTYMMIKDKEDEDVKQSLNLPPIHHEIVQYQINGEEHDAHKHYVDRAEVSMKKYEDLVRQGKSPQETFVVNGKVPSPEYE